MKDERQIFKSNEMELHYGKYREVPEYISKEKPTIKEGYYLLLTEKHQIVPLPTELMVAIHGAVQDMLSELKPVKSTTNPRYTFWK